MKELRRLISPFSQILTNAAYYCRMNANKADRFGYDKKLKVQFQMAERDLNAARRIMETIWHGNDKKTAVSFNMRSDEGDLLYRVDEKLLPRDIQFNLDGGKDVITVREENFRAAIIETAQFALEQYETGYVLYDAKGKTKFVCEIEYDDGKREVSEFLREDFPTVTYHFEEADIRKHIHMILMEARKENFRSGWINVEDSEDKLGAEREFVYATGISTPEYEARLKKYFGDKSKGDYYRVASINFEAQNAYYYASHEARADLLAIAAEYKENWYEE